MFHLEFSRKERTYISIGKNKYWSYSGIEKLTGISEYSN